MCIIETVKDGDFVRYVDYNECKYGTIYQAKYNKQERKMELVPFYWLGGGSFYTMNLRKSDYRDEVHIIGSKKDTELMEKMKEDGSLKFYKLTEPWWHKKYKK